jgi:hypothetical protein
MYGSPCECSTRRVACPKVVDSFETCQGRFQEYYDQHTACVENDIEAVPKVSFVGPWFLLCYFGYAGTLLLVMLWCFLNQKVFPVETSTKPLVTANMDTNETWTQTGYKSCLIGTAIYILVELSFVVIQFLLLITTLFYYMQQGGITRWKPVFEDEIQVLMVFQIVWMAGFVWCFSFRYPDIGVYPLFLRRCALSEATHVAVVAPIQSTAGNKVPTLARRILSVIWTPIDCVFRLIFSYPYGQTGTETEFCPIMTDSRTGTRSMLHRLRRYTFGENVGCFVPCVMSVGVTFDELLRQIDGLSQDEADGRRGIQGPNVIPLEKPTVIGSLRKEFGKAFYLYQNFSVWSFANFFYYFMAIVNTFVRVTGALIVTYHQYKSECLLYKLAHVEGTAKYVCGCFVGRLRCSTHMLSPLRWSG